MKWFLFLISLDFNGTKIYWEILSKGFFFSIRENRRKKMTKQHSKTYCLRKISSKLFLFVHPKKLKKNQFFSQKSFEKSQLFPIRFLIFELSFWKLLRYSKSFKTFYLFLFKNFQLFAWKIFRHFFLKKTILIFSLKKIKYEFFNKLIFTGRESIWLISKIKFFWRYFYTRNIIFDKRFWIFNFENW